MKELKYMEFSFKQTIVFAVGGEQGNNIAASIAAIRFSSNIKVITEYSLKTAGEMAYSLKRHDNGNILCVGATSKVLILFFDGVSFESISEYCIDSIGRICHI